MNLRSAFIAAILMALPSAVYAARERQLAVLTYNVHGLPWPLTSGRAADFDRIEQRLLKLRAAGRQPSVVVLQEAFTERAQQIGEHSGYRYVAFGPDHDQRTPEVVNAEDRAFLDTQAARSGETEGKLLGSGLAIFSDYPIEAVRRVAFPGYACAGYDCLANKGALLARVELPGRGAVEIATTHLNSKGASGAPDARSLYAYRRQIDTLDRFLARARDPRLPLVVAGDFNVGQSAARRSYLVDHARGWSAADLLPTQDALHACAGRNSATWTVDASTILRRGKDWQFFVQGAGSLLSAGGIDVPFGREADGTMLSDHMGFVARYLVAPASGRPSTRGTLIAALPGHTG